MVGVGGVASRRKRMAVVVVTVVVTAHMYRMGVCRVIARIRAAATAGGGQDTTVTIRIFTNHCQIKHACCVRRGLNRVT